MDVGLTYDLRDDYLGLGFSEEETAEFDRGDTIDAIETALQDLGYRTDRIGNVQSLASRLVKGERWDMVFNIAEGVRGFGREAQVPALLEAYGVPYTFSDSLVLSLSLHKGMAKRVFRDMALPTPGFFVVETERDLERNNLPFPLFAKPVAEGTGKGIDHASRVENREELFAVCRRLLLQHRQPVLVESFLPGRELTVGILGTGENSRVLAAMEVVLKDRDEAAAYCYHVKENFKGLVEYRLATDAVAAAAAQTALRAWVGLGGRDSGRIDLRTDAAGVPNLLEVNPLAGLHPEHSDLCIMATLAGMDYRTLIGEIMRSAEERTAQIGIRGYANRWAA